MVCQENFDKFVDNISTEGNISIPEKDKIKIGLNVYQ